MNELFDQARTSRVAYDNAIALLKTLNQDPKNNSLVKRGVELVRQIVWPNFKQQNCDTQVEDLTETLDKLSHLNYRVVEAHNNPNSN